MSAHEDNDHEYRKLEIWTRGLISSLDELEQSWFAVLLPEISDRGLYG